MDLRSLLPDFDNGDNAAKPESLSVEQLAEILRTSFAAASINHRFAPGDLMQVKPAAKLFAFSPDIPLFMFKNYLPEPLYGHDYMGADMNDFSHYAAAMIFDCITMYAENDGKVRVILASSSWFEPAVL